MVATDLVLLDDDERPVVGDREPCRGGELGGRLGDGGHDPGSVGVPHRPLQLGLLGGGREVPAFGLQLGDHRRRRRGRR